MSTRVRCTGEIMKMRVLKLMAVAVGLGAPMGAGAEPKVTSSVRAEVKDNIPGAIAKPPAPIEYPEPTGNLSVKIIQFCGDGDVAHYAENRRSWRHQVKGQVGLVLGYYMAPASGPQVPTPANHFALGTITLDLNGDQFRGVGRDIWIDENGVKLREVVNGDFHGSFAQGPVQGAYVNKFLPADKDPRSSNINDYKNMLVTAKETAQLLVGNTGFRMGSVASSDDSYNLYFTLMACPAVKEAEKSNLHPARISKTLQEKVSQFVAAAQTQVERNSSWDDFESDTRVNVDRLATGDIRADLGRSGTRLDPDSDDHPLDKLARRVFNVSQPDSSLSLAQYRDAIASRSSSFKDNLEGLADALATRSACAQVQRGVSTRDRYSWEAYALQHTCGALNAGNRAGLQSLVRAFFNPDNTSSGEWKTNRKKLIAALVAGAQLQRVQEVVEKRIHENDWKLPKQRCFDVSPYVDYTYQSLAIKMEYSASDPLPMEYEAIHPEPGFAIGQDKPYFDGGGAGDTYTVFKMFPGVDPASYRWPIERGTPVSVDTDSIMPKGVRAHFHLRGVGCPTNVYCRNEMSAPGKHTERLL